MATRGLPRRLRVAAGTALIVFGANVLWQADRIAEGQVGPFLDRDVRYPASAGPAGRALPPLGRGEFGVWVEFDDPPPDLAGVAWEVATTDLGAGVAVDLDNELGASSHSSDGKSGVRIGRFRAAAGRRYRQEVRCSGGPSREVLGRDPSIRLMAPPGLRKVDGFRSAFNRLRVESGGFLIMVAGAVWLWAGRPGRLRGAGR